MLMNFICNMCSEITLPKWLLRIAGTNELTRFSPKQKDYDIAYKKVVTSRILYTRISQHDHTANTLYTGSVE